MNRVRPLLRSLALATVFLIITACDSPQEREAKHLQNGKELYASGDLVKALLEFRNALQINPTGVDARYLVGLILERQGNFPAAISAFQEVSMQAPNHQGAQEKLGRYALLGANPERALLHADKLIAIAPSSPTGHTMRGAALLMEGKLNDAEIETKAALALKPNDPDALVVLASQRARQQKFDEAVSLIDGGLKADTRNSELWSFKLKLLRDQGKTTEANNVLRELMVLEPDNPQHVLSLAKSLQADHRTSEAHDVFRRAIAASAAPGALLGAYADFLDKTQGPDVAVRTIKPLIAAIPKTDNYGLLLARLHVRAGHLDDAQAILENLIDRLPTLSDKLDARVELAHIADLRGKRDDALSQLNAILKEDSGNHNALLMRASLHFVQGRYDDTIADARSALSTDPASHTALTVLAHTYLATDERELAIATFRTLATVAPEDVDARLKLSGLLAVRSPGEAVQHLDAAIALQPDIPDLQVSKAQILIYSRQEDKGEMIGRALLEDPATAPAGHQILGEAALVRKDYKTAISELTTALDLGRDFAIVGPKLTQAHTLAQANAGTDEDASGGGNSVDSEKILTDRIERNPRDADALILLADLRQRNGDLAMAEDFLRRAIQAAPQMRAAYLHLSLILKQRGDKSGTVALLEGAARVFPDDSLVAESVAIAYEIAGDYAKAKDAYDSILVRWPGSIVAANNLAQLIADLWPSDKALLDRARALTERFRNTNNATLLDTLGWVQLRLDNIDDATVQLSKAIALAPNDQQMLYHYAMALSRKDLKDKARLVLAGALVGQPDFRGVEEARKLSVGLKQE